MTESAIVFLLFFYLLVGVVLLNVVFGIILDAFATLRQADSERREHMLNTCFICGLQRSGLEATLKDQNAFDDHITGDHDMWVMPTHTHHMHHLHTCASPPHQWACLCDGFQP